MILIPRVQRGTLSRCLLVIILGVSILSGLASMMPAHHAIARQGAEQAHPFGEPTAPIAERHVYDLANVLDEAQIITIESDADRLQRFGIPAVIITVASDMTPEEAARQAASVRRDWGIATSPGADDGLVFLVVVPASDQGEAFATLSWGADALPHEGLTATVSEQIYQQWVGIWLDEPQVFEAITYGLRRMIYHVIYDPAPEEPLAGARELAHSVLTWLAPLIVIGAGIVRFTNVGFARRPTRRPALPGWVSELRPFLLTLLLAIVSIWAQSEIGVACTGILLIASLVLWIRRDDAPRASAASTWPQSAIRDGA